MSTRHIALIGFFLLQAFGDLGAQSRTLTVDLGIDPGEATRIRVPSGQELEVVITSMLPGDRQAYQVFVEIRAEPIAPLSIPGAGFSSVELPLARELDGCRPRVERYAQAYNELGSAEVERQVRSRVSALREAIEHVSEHGCAFPPDIPEDDALELIDRTRRPIQRSYQLARGERLEVTVIRNVGSEGESPVWKYVFTTGARGEWRVSYGFSFIVDVIDEEKTFFTQQQDSLFRITPEVDRDDLTFLPTLFFTWMPASRANSSLAWSLSGGLGFDLDNPVVSLGLSVTYNSNLSINTGLAAHKLRALRGRFREGQLLRESLDDGQLHEEVYRVNPYLALAFRFGGSPFEGTSDEE